jgi:hypothetical protein
MLCGALPCIPGLDTLARGFDLATGSSDALLPIFDFVEQNPKGYATYQNPQNTSLKYMVPPTVIVTDNTKADDSAASSAFLTSSEYAHSMTMAVGAGGSYMGFGASAEVKHASSVLDNSQDFGSFAFSELLVRLYDAVVQPETAPLTLAFTSALATLNNTADDAAYKTFFGRYGTHYISSATFGGKGTMTTSVGRAYASHATTTDTSAQASANFGFVKASGSGGSSTKKVDASFTSSSHWSTKMIGGDTTLVLSKWSEWVKTFYNSPAQVEFKVQPISELIRTRVPAAVAAALQNKSIAYVGAAGRECATELDELAVANKKLACIRALMNSDCCEYVDSGGTFNPNYMAGLKCTCNEQMDSALMFGEQRPCNEHIQADGRCKNNEGDSGTPIMLYMEDVAKCIGVGAYPKCVDNVDGNNFCSEWCNTKGKWACGIGFDNTPNYQCDCSGCNGCP